MDTGLEWWRIVALILIVGSLGVAAIWLNREKIAQKISGNARRGNQIIIQERYWVSPKTEVLLMKVENESFLLAHNPQHLSWQKLSPSPFSHEKAVD